MEPKTSFLTGSKQERIVIVAFAPFLAVLCIGALIATEARFGHTSEPQPLLDLLSHAMFFEMFLAFLLFLVLAFIWALFRPDWIERTLRYVGSHVWHALCFFLAGFLLSLLILNA